MRRSSVAPVEINVSRLLSHHVRERKTTPFDLAQSGKATPVISFESESHTAKGQATRSLLIFATLCLASLPGLAIPLFILAENSLAGRYASKACSP